MNKDKDIIELLRHTRHDWLNRIQLIKGNLSLNKIDRVHQIIETIIVEAQQEARLSNLKLPMFAEKMITYNWDGNSFQLEYEVLNETICDGIHDEYLTEWMTTLLDCLQKSVKPYQDNHLYVSIDPQLNGVSFFFDFSGIIEDKVALIQFLSQNTEPFLQVFNENISDDAFTLELFLEQKETQQIE